MKQQRETKAERIFRDSRKSAMNAIDAFGAGEIDRLQRLNHGEDEKICKRTVNEVEEIAERYVRYVKILMKYGTVTNEEAAYLIEAANIVVNTCKRWHKLEEEFKAI